MHKAHWYIARLSSMSIAEIWHRTQERALATYEYYQVRKGKRYSPLSLDLIAEHFEKFKGDETPAIFPFVIDDYNVRSQWEQSFPEEITATLQTAQNILSGQISLFDKPFTLSHDHIWKRDPLTGNVWPAAFYKQIDTRDGQTNGGVLWVWRLNRHHHLATLAKAYYLTGDELYATAVCQQIANWIEQNPPLLGVNWTSSLELAVRLFNWLWAIHWVKSSPAFTQDLFAQIMVSIQAQATYIEHHLSAYSSANNHRIGEAAGLAIVGLSLPFLPCAPQWQAQGFRILEEEISLQIYADGVTAEQAIHYLTFVLDFYLFVWTLALRQGLPIPTICRDRLNAAANFIQAIMDEEGNVPALGDSDDAWVVRLDDRQTVNNYHSILATLAVLLNRPDLKASAGRWDEKSHWLLGEVGKSQFTKLDSVFPSQKSQLFHAGGYCVMRTPGHVITLDCGPLGYLATAAHGHADALSITISVEGQPLLIDPGTYAYQEGGIWRDYFRGTAAHNTILVNEQNQSEITGTFLWSAKANARLLHWQTTEDFDFVVADHDGYTKKLGVLHQRALLYSKPSLIVVQDQLTGITDQKVCQLWHLSAQTNIQMEDENSLSIISNSKRFPLWTSVGAHAVDIKNGHTDPIHGWASSHYGSLEPTPVISVSAKASPTVQITTIFGLSPNVHPSIFHKQCADALEKINLLLSEVKR